MCRCERECDGIVFGVLDVEDGDIRTATGKVDCAFFRFGGGLGGVVEGRGYIFGCRVRSGGGGRGGMIGVEEGRMETWCCGY